MKMTGEHYRELLREIRPLMDIYPLQNYLDKGLNNKIYRWDLLWKVVDNGIDLNLYDYLTDACIDTALRKITNTK